MLPYVIGVLLAGVMVTLFAGLTVMTRGGPDGPRRSNLLMRWRVGLQAATVIAVLAYLLLARF